MSPLGPPWLQKSPSGRITQKLQRNNMKKSPTTEPTKLDRHPDLDQGNASYAAEGGSHPAGGGSDPFDLSNISVAATSIEDLGIERPILTIPVQKPGRQEFFRTHPDPKNHLEVRLITLEAEREQYLVTANVWPAIPGETKLVRLTPYLTRTGALGLWPLALPDDLLGKRDTNWGITARKAAEFAETKWVRIQANMGRGQYDVVTTDRVPDPVWPDIGIQQMIRIAFSDGRLIDSLDHPVIRQLAGD